MDIDGARSPASTIAASEVDDRMASASSPLNPDLPSIPDLPRADAKSAPDLLAASTPSKRAASAKGDGDSILDEPEAEAPPSSAPRQTKRAKAAAAKEIAANAPNASIYSGNKVRHLKKDDGEPLWRKDIQYDFLYYVFNNMDRVFTNSYEPELGMQTFAELYIDAMARSSKTSKILRDKLLSEHEPAKNMAMVCLLVNLGRMNTTLNFFPEMRAQLRTYHAIPSLQAYQDPNSYKQLQDAPRLKSILKGASEDRKEPTSLDKITNTPIPRTNPVNLIFVLAQYAPRITDVHFPPQRDFYDLIMRPSLSSHSRAYAFLWLMWFYLQSDFTREGAAENPFGPGVDYGQGHGNQGVPEFRVLTEAEQKMENVDKAREIEYGEEKMRERKRIIEADQADYQAVFPPKRGPKPKLNLPPEDGASPAPLLPRIRPSKYESDMDSNRSTPPPRAYGAVRMNAINSTRRKAPLANQIMDLNSSPVPSMTTIGVEGSTRRMRPLTAHQIAVEQNRNQRVNYILSRGLRKKHHQARKLRRKEGAFVRAQARLNRVQNPFEDSEGEESLNQPKGPFRERGFAGLVQLESEDDDFGEEAAAYAAAFRRMGRRLDRWDLHRGGELGVMGTNRVVKPEVVVQEAKEDTEEMQEGDTVMQEEEDLDEMEKELLGLGSEGDAEEDLDDVDKALLGIGGDETEEEMDVD